MTLLEPFRGYAVILLLHLINKPKIAPLDWEVSIRNAVREIQPENKRRKAGDIT